MRQFGGDGEHELALTERADSQQVVLGGSADTGHARIRDVEAAEPMKVTLTEPAIAGSYLIEPQEDGTLVLVPEGKEPTIAAIREREGARAATDEEFRGTFGDLPSDSEG